MSSPNLLHVRQVTVAPELVNTIDVALSLLDINVSRWESADGNELRFDIYFEDEDEAMRRASILRRQLMQHAGNHAWDITIQDIPNKNGRIHGKSSFV